MRRLVLSSAILAAGRWIDRASPGLVRSAQRRNGLRAAVSILHHLVTRKVSDPDIAGCT